jgi:antibiotic biosynthesis monooxygenase (ABM) superfamily enzyme
MSTSPVTLMVARRVAKGRYEELMAWLREGEQLATDFPGVQKKRRKREVRACNNIRNP